MLMDMDTLLAHRDAHWGAEPKPVRHDLPRLTPAEAAVYDALLLHPEFDRLYAATAWVGC